MRVKWQTGTYINSDWRFGRIIDYVGVGNEVQAVVLTDEKRLEGHYIGKLTIVEETPKAPSKQFHEGIY